MATARYTLTVAWRVKLCVVTDYKLVYKFYMKIVEKHKHGEGAEAPPRPLNLVNFCVYILSV